jgi:hypothetical protein
MSYGLLDSMLIVIDYICNVDYHLGRISSRAPSASTQKFPYEDIQALASTIPQDYPNGFVTEPRSRSANAGTLGHWKKSTSISFPHSSLH